MENYFNYFTEIEEHFQRRRGSILLLSTLDWALIETWREAGIPLEAVLRGIDAAFDRYDARKRTGSRRINGLAWCAQAVMTAAEEMQEASLGAAKPEADRGEGGAGVGADCGDICGRARRDCGRRRGLTGVGAEAAAEIAERLTQMAAMKAEAAPQPEELEKTLTALEEKLLHAVMATTCGGGAGEAAGAERGGDCAVSAADAGAADSADRAAVSAQAAAGEAQSAAAEPVLYEAGLKLRIEKAIYGGAGLARAEGKAVFVPFALPGELVEAAIAEENKGYATAELVEVLEPSANRRAAPCPYFGACGGCHYQHADYAAQVEMKRAILREALERARVREIPEIEAVTGEPFGYRNRVRLHVEKNPFHLCYKRRNSHVNLPVEACPIAAPVLEELIGALNR